MGARAAPPGVADVRLLDWAPTPSNLAALARACGELAAEGLLSVVWPVLDDVLLASLRAPRMLAGTAEVAETMRSLLPAVLAAVASGAATAASLEVPGVRALAARAGSSNAVTAARATVRLLPDAVSPVVPAAPVERPVSPFDEVWAPGAGRAPRSTTAPRSPHSGSTRTHPAGCSPSTSRCRAGPTRRTAW